MPKHHLIVDGYNVIRQTQPYLDIAERDDWEQARDALVADVAAYVSGDTHATVVFDGTSNPTSSGVPVRLHGVSVIFSPFGLTADSVIERMARESREHAEVVEVVTSDAQTQWAVLGQRVVRRSSREFGERLADEDAERSEVLASQSSRVPVIDRISPEAREMLEKLRHGGRHHTGSADRSEGADRA